MTNNQLTDAQFSNATLIRLIRWADEHKSHYVAAALRELQERRKADSEPVAWTDEQELRDVDRGGCGYLFTVNPVTPHADERRIILLYRHAQQPVVPENCPAEIRDLIASHSDALFNDDDAQEIWNACRAAMLSGGKS